MTVWFFLSLSRSLGEILLNRSGFKSVHAAAVFKFQTRHSILDSIHTHAANAPHTYTHPSIYLYRYTILCDSSRSSRSSCATLIDAILNHERTRDILFYFFSSFFHLSLRVNGGIFFFAEYFRYGVITRACARIVEIFLFGNICEAGRVATMDRCYTRLHARQN